MDNGRDINLQFAVRAKAITNSLNYSFATGIRGHANQVGTRSRELMYAKEADILKGELNKEKVSENVKEKDDAEVRKIVKRVDLEPSKAQGLSTCLTGSTTLGSS